MKIYKIAAAMLAAFLLLAGCALAAESIDASRDVSLTVQFQNNGAALSGAQFKLYRIASVDNTGKAALVSPFDRYNVRINVQSESDMAGVASTLEGYVLRDQLAPSYAGSTDSAGTVAFPASGKMQQGLYLVLGERYIAEGIGYTIQPSVVQLPAWNAADERWNYDVTINAKHEAAPDTSVVTRKVLKVWKNTEGVGDIPKEVVVHLLQDGEVYDTVQLNAENLWRHTWEELDANRHWTVVEEEMDDYDVLVTREGITFVVTNTYDPEEPVPTPTPRPTPPPDNPPDDPKLPQTGQLWWPVPMLVSLGLLLIVIGLLRRRGS